MKPILTAENVHKSYDRNKLHVLKGINLTVQEGEILVILGPSGAGKSTLLHILGLLDEPSRGNVVINGVNCGTGAGRKKAQIRGRKTGFVFQFYNLLPDFNVLENVCLPSLFLNRSFKIGKTTEKKARSILEWVGLSERIKHRPGELSGGEQQRVSLARAVMNEPKLLFADEPTGNLDSKSAENVRTLLMKLNREKNQTIIIVTHNEKLAECGTRRLYLEDGLIKDCS